MKRIVIAVGCVVVIAITLAALSRLYDAGYRAGHNVAESAWRQRWSQRDLADATMALHHEVAIRAEENRRQIETENEVNHAEIALADAHSEYLHAESVAGELQSELDRIRRQLKQSEAGRIAATAEAGKAKAQVTAVLAELLSESDQLAGKFASEADANFIAGTACERIYDRVTGMNFKKPVS